MDVIKVNFQGLNQEPKKFDSNVFFRKKELKFKKSFYKLTLNTFKKKKLFEVMEGYGYDVMADEFCFSFIPDYVKDYSDKNNNSFKKVNEGKLSQVLNLKNNTKSGNTF
jgi:hypothetical protein